jgi:hypothetical protein
MAGLFILRLAPAPGEEHLVALALRARRTNLRACTKSRRTSARLWYLAAALWEAAPILPQYIR